MPAELPIRITNAGKGIVFNAGNTGIDFDLTHMQLGVGNRTMTGEEIALVYPVLTSPISGGEKITPTQIRVIAGFDITQNLNLSEVGLWSGDPTKPGSTLFAYYVLEKGFFAQVSNGVEFVFEHDLALEETTGQYLNLVIDDSVNGAYALRLIERHEKNTDAHPAISEALSKHLTDPDAHNELLQNLTKRAMPVFAAGEALPTKNIGPIWHETYNSVMTWQVFSKNGAAYAGYASVDVGRLATDTQPTPRPGEVPLASVLAEADFPQLLHWGMHHGLMVAETAWVAGTITIKRNGKGQFTLYDVRGEFQRIADQGRGVDVGRVAGAWQGDAIRNITGVSVIRNAEVGASFVDAKLTTGVFYATDLPSNTSAQSATVNGVVNNGTKRSLGFDASLQVPTASDNRPRNVALPGYVKF